MRYETKSEGTFFQSLGLFEEQSITLNVGGGELTCLDYSFGTKMKALLDA